MVRADRWGAQRCGGLQRVGADTDDGRSERCRFGFRLAYIVHFYSRIGGDDHPLAKRRPSGFALPTMNKLRLRRGERAVNFR